MADEHEIAEAIRNMTQNSVALRDFYAAHAMQALLALAGTKLQEKADEPRKELIWGIAKEAFEIAETMVFARDHWRDKGRTAAW